MLHRGLLSQSGQKVGLPNTDWAQRFKTLAEIARDPRLKAFYAAGAVPGDTLVEDTPLMALDVETTGLAPARDGMVSIGLVPMSLTCIRASASRHWLLKPREPLGAESITIHGITHTQVQTAPDLNEVLGDVLQAMAGHVLVVHCRDIERQFLSAALQRRLGERIEFPVIDTMELEARLYRSQRRGLMDWVLGRQPPQVSIRLADSRRRYGLPRYRPHHALTDALASAELLQAQVAHRFTPDAPISALWC
ncbi:3'-5' exonuclease [Rhodoferax sp. PAMC 29310]|uniref:3'-5' exonuclease n=1 Tax=Rhodoferax sp. PAMC 29310 TaxID=2822760 RepID=UPI001B32615C|nr:3'-5' exonuclease [Rhodoferax sp. PAMC 29310]